MYDISYTTSQSPIPADKYYEYLITHYPYAASSIKGFIEYEIEEDVSLEHGLLKERGQHEKLTYYLHTIMILASTYKLEREGLVMLISLANRIIAGIGEGVLS